MVGVTVPAGVRVDVWLVDVGVVTPLVDTLVTGTFDSH